MGTQASTLALIAAQHSLLYWRHIIADHQAASMLVTFPMQRLMHPAGHEPVAFYHPEHLSGV